MATCVTVGTEAVIEGTFRDADGALSTPTVYELDHKDPWGNTATITQGNITVASTGVLRASVPTDEEGVWRYRWRVTVGTALVLVGSFCVEDDEF